MQLGFVAFSLLAINPVGGLAVAVPFAVFKLHYPAWLILAVGIPLAYVQVLTVDLGWTLLARTGWWFRFLERRRSARIEKLIASRGAFFGTMVLAPLIGPWLVMAFMRYAQVPQRRVALPILLGITWAAVAFVAACTVVPELFKT